MLNTNKTGNDGLYGNNLAFVADMFDNKRDFNVKVKAFGSKTPEKIYKMDLDQVLVSGNSKGILDTMSAGGV